MLDPRRYVACMRIDVSLADNKQTTQTLPLRHVIVCTLIGNCCGFIVRTRGSPRSREARGELLLAARMVNFTEKLEANVRAEWSSYYVDYKALKKAMKKAMTPCASPDCAKLRAKSKGEQLQEPLLPGGADAEMTTTPVHVFIKCLDEQRDKVQSFYEEELQRLTEQHNSLEAQLSRAAELTSSERSSVTLASTDLYRTLQHLRNFCILNYTGLLKAAKKFDKKSGTALLGKSKEDLDNLSFVQNTEIDDLSNKLESAFAWAFCEGSLQVNPSQRYRVASLVLHQLDWRLDWPACARG